MFPDLSAYPLVASILGGMFVGIGVGIIVRQGGSSGGDDALALVINKLTGWKLPALYLLRIWWCWGLRCPIYRRDESPTLSSQ